MKDSNRLNFTKRGVWRRTGFLVRNEGAGKFLFSDLNPQVMFTHVLTRWEQFRFGIWLIRQSIWKGQSNG